MSSGTPPPARRILPDVPISEQGLRQLEIWLLGQMRSLLKGIPETDLTNYLHWGVNEDASFEGLTLTGHGAFAFDSDGRDFSISTGVATGRLSLDSGGATFTGTSGGGAMTLDAEGGAVTVQTSGSGTIALATAGGIVQVDSNGGDILVASSDGDIHIDSSNGELNLDSDNEIALNAPVISLGTDGTEAHLTVDYGNDRVVIKLPTGKTFEVWNNAGSPLVTYTG